MSTLSPSTPLRVGIIGAGVAGLGTAILFSRQENVQVEIFEQARELREVGAGIHLHHNIYRMLEIVDARDGITTHSGTTSQAPIHQQRNGRTLEVLGEKDWSSEAPENRPVRTERTVLQKALIAKLPSNIPVQLRKRLIKYEETEAGIHVHFEDGTTTVVDLLVGADGIRSVVRHLTFPDNKMTYTGVIGYRTLLPWDDVKDIPDLPDGTLFSHGPEGHIFTTQVGNGKYEISTRVNLPEEKSQVSWGQPVAKSEVLRHYQDFHPALKAILEASSEDGWKQFAMFAAPRLETVVNESGNVALLGDASHPLAGAFGAGAGFALEDAYVLTAAVEYARANSRPLSVALKLYDQTRSPYYQLLYEILAGHANNAKELNLHEDGLSFDEAVERKIKAMWGGGDSSFIHTYDVKHAFEITLKAELEREKGVADAPTADLAEDLAASHL